MSALPALHSGVQAFFESQHQGPVNDVSVEPCGKVVATCGDEGSIHLYHLPADVAASSSQLSRIGTLVGTHRGPVVRLAWASKPPINTGQEGAKRGAFLASAGLDCQVVIWFCDDVIGNAATWQPVCVRSFAAPTISLSWAPPEFGYTLACACSDGRVNLVDNTNPQDPSLWGGNSFEGHIIAGCSGVSWAPFLPPGCLSTMPLNQVQLMAASQGGANASLQVPNPVPRLVTSGFERTLRVWRFSRVDKHWVHEHDLTMCGGDDETVRDVSWAPNIGAPFSYIAAGSTSGRVCIWLQDGLEGMWRCIQLPRMEAPVCRVHWSHLGTFLTVTYADGTCSTWKEQPTGDWDEVLLIEGRPAAE